MALTENRIRALALATLTSVGVFPLIVLALNVRQAPDGYNAGRDAVSDLALGRGGAMMALAFCSLAVGTLLYAALLQRSSGRAPVRTSMLRLAGALSFVSAAFHTDATGAAATTHGEIHNAAGIATFVAMLAAMATSAWRFRRDSAWGGFALPTTVLALAGVAGFLLVPALGQDHFGISQRILIGSFLTWMIAGAAYQLKNTSHRTSAPTLVSTVGTE